jgi:AcrR family transcriptional regulator
MYTVSTRQPLDRERVLAAAVAFADARGIEPLSMRALAGDLGVVPMALYKHVADKDDLLGGMIDAVVAGYALPDPELAWRERVRARVMTARASLAAHPWLPAAIAARATPTPAVLAHMDAIAGDFVSGGLSVDLTHHAMHALGHRIWGYSPEAFPGGAAPSGGDEEQAAQAGVFAQHFPHVFAIAMDAAARSGIGACDADAEFAFTLDLLLDAFERLHASGWESRPMQ